MNRPKFYLGLVWYMLLMAAPGVQAQTFYQYERSGQHTLFLGLGISKYFGDLSDDRRLGDLNPHLSVGVTLPVKTRFSLRPEATYYRISAADSKLQVGDSRRNRNLSFRSDNFEVSVLGVYELYKRTIRGRSSRLKPYVMAGAGVTFFNPKAELNGVWHELQPLLTEGVKYDKLDLVFPAGAGLGYSVGREFQLALEISYRFSFTDYLDDVSKTYRDQLSFTDPIAAALADRRPEIGLELAPAGSRRGNPDSNDGYLFLGFKGFYKLPGQGPLRRKR